MFQKHFVFRSHNNETFSYILVKILIKNLRFRWNHCLHFIVASKNTGPCPKMLSPAKKLLETLIHIQALKFNLSSLFLSRPFLKKGRIGILSSEKVVMISLLNKIYSTFSTFQKQPSRGVLRKKCFENIQQNYRRILMPKRDFNKVAKQLQSCIFPENLLLRTFLDGCF